jgi:hypothetical protein
LPVFRPFIKPTQDQLPVPRILRLVVTPEARPGRFTARLESGEVIVTNTGQPLADGARELIARGFPAGLLLTLHHVDKPSDCFTPLSIGQWARWSYTESDRDGLRKVRWMPRQLHAGGQKSTSEAAPGPGGPAVAGIAVRRHLSGGQP